MPYAIDLWAFSPKLCKVRFLSNILLGEDNSLKNREMHIHFQDIVNVGVNNENVPVNAEKFPVIGKKFLRAFEDESKMRNCSVCGNEKSNCYMIADENKYWWCCYMIADENKYWWCYRCGKIELIE